MTKLDKKTLSYKNFESLLGEINDRSREEPPDRYSTYWFFLRYVHRLLKIAKKSSRPADLDSAIRGVTRFYIDVKNPSPLLTDQFDSIRHEYSLLKRIHQNTDDSA